MTCMYCKSITLTSFSIPGLMNIKLALLPLIHTRDSGRLPKLKVKLRVYSICHLYISMTQTTDPSSQMSWRDWLHWLHWPFSGWGSGQALGRGSGEGFGTAWKTGRDRLEIVWNSGRERPKTVSGLLRLGSGLREPRITAVLISGGGLWGEMSWVAQHMFGRDCMMIDLIRDGR